MTDRAALLLEFLTREPLEPRYAVTQPKDARKADLLRLRCLSVWLAERFMVHKGEQ